MKKTSIYFLILSLFSFVSFTGCKTTPEAKSDAPDQETEVRWEKPRTPDWHKNANIYEVNLRHYTDEATFKSFEAHVPRLKEMGVDILWFMPIHQVSVKERKGELGSPYAVTDYTGVNPDYGTMDDFKHMLQVIHDAGMRCIIDWVPNHTGWDSKWITEHPDWYTKDAEGNVTDPINAETGEPWGWTDVADLNYDNAEMRLAMIDAMKFWIADIGIDGFRVDVAHGVPTDFWEQCTDSLFKIKPIFMLAEAEIHEFVNVGAFEMDYGWEMHHTLNEIAKTQGANKGGKKLVQGNVVEGSDDHSKATTAKDIDKVLKKYANNYKKGYKMHFTSNHDENSWAGTEFDRMGDGHKAFAVLTATFDGMPLIYTGQEAAMDKMLEFFKKDDIPWGEYVYADFYKTLLGLKHRNEALWNGEYGGELVKIPSGNDDYIYAFTREKNGDKVVVIINLSSEQQEANLTGDNFAGAYTNVFDNSEVTLAEGESMTMEAWDYLVLEQSGK